MRLLVAPSGNVGGLAGNVCAPMAPGDRVLPAGTVTLLFTDVEGSTRLLDDLGPERYG